jgi:hypothetical protein
MKERRKEKRKKEIRNERMNGKKKEKDIFISPY